MAVSWLKRQGICRPKGWNGAARDDISRAINNCYDTQEQERELDQLQLSDCYREDDQAMWKEAERLANETPIVKLVNSIILDAVHQRASDIHIRRAAIAWRCSTASTAP